MKLDDLENTQFSDNSRLNFDHDLSKLNWFNIGGKAKIFFKAENLIDLSLFLKEFHSEKNIFVIGAGSNILLTDKLYDGIVIKLGKNFSNISLLPNNLVVAGAAVTDKKLSDFALNNEIGGFEFLSCIPGSVGGGIRMNSGCFGSEFKDILISVQAINRFGEVLTIPRKEIIFDYRYCNLSKDLIFLSASFEGSKKKRRN